MICRGCQIKHEAGSYKCLYNVFDTCIIFTNSFLVEDNVGAARIYNHPSYNVGSFLGKKNVHKLVILYNYQLSYPKRGC